MWNRILSLYLAFSCGFYPLISNAAELPDLGSRAAYELPPAKERELGLQFMQAVTSKSALVNDPFVNNYMKQLGQRLYTYARVPSDPITPHLFVVKSATVNAFTGPGGYIGINSGLILMTQSESELAGVMAHEMAHMTRHHIARMIQQAKAQTLPTLGALFAAILVGVAGGGQAGAGAVNAVLAGSAQNAIDYIRQHEYEADRIGMRIMQQAGFDPWSLPQFFIRLQQHTSDYANIMPEYLRTHPFAQSRIADLENRLADYPKPKVASSEDYYLMRARLQFLTMNNDAYSLSTFTAQLKKQKNPQVIAATEYGYALALAKKRQYARAQEIIAKLIQQDQQQVLYPMAAAEIAQMQNNNQEALRILQMQFESHPKYYPLVMQYADVLLNAGQADKARRILTPLSAQYKNDILFYQLLARAQAKAGYLAAAYQTRAKMFTAEGRAHAARVQLQQALAQAGLDEVQRGQINRELLRLQRDGG